MKYQAITNCRVSSDEQLKNNSLNRQQRAVLNAAKRLDVEIPKDGQWSGSVSSKRGKNYDRKDLKEMLEYCKKHKRVKYVIVDEPDRFMRSVDEAFAWETRFRHEVNVRVYYASDETLNTDDSYARMMRFMKYFAAETSNEERQHKSIEGDKTAILEGRYTFRPKLGYMKGDRPGVHIIAPVIGEIMRTILTKLANDLLTVTESLEEYNRSSYVRNGKHCPYRMDKWRKIVTDPYYAGIVEMSKQVQARNEHGLHEPMITKEQHLHIVDLVSRKRKVQNGPRKGGNPDFILNTITLCEQCYQTEFTEGKTEKHNKGKFVGFCHGNGHTDKVYKRYRCRKCGRLILRDELHQEVEKYLRHVYLTQQGHKLLEKQLLKVWQLEEENQENEIRAIKNKITSLTRTNQELVEKLTLISSTTTIQVIEDSIEQNTQEITELQTKLNQFNKDIEVNRSQFISFALDFANNLATHFFELTPEEAKLCKLLLFPDGFLVTSENKVYTTKISPFYRLQTNKKDTRSVNFDLMVE